VTRWIASSLNVATRSTVPEEVSEVKSSATADKPRGSSRYDTAVSFNVLARGDSL